MAAMVIVMVVFLVMSGHHGMGGPQGHDAKPSAAETTHMHEGDAAKPQDTGKQ